MRINELLVEQQLDELSLKGLGQGIGKAVGGVVGGAGQIAKNIWSGAKQGYDAGRAALDPNAPDSEPETPAAPSGGNTGGPGEVASTDLLARAKQGTAQDPAAQTPAPAPTAQDPAAQTPAPAPTAPAPTTTTAPANDQQSKVGVGQINKIIPTLRTRDLNSVKKTVDATIAKKTKAPVAPAAPAAPAPTATPPAEDDNPNIVRGYNNESKVIKFKSRFLGMDI